MEDDKIYYNDEWNLDKLDTSNIEQLKRYQKLYDILYSKMQTELFKKFQSNEILENYLKQQDDIKRTRKI
ncbi:MAG TPA: hypothetical protein VF680_16935 [Allosphingosinicella sp.]|jgi:hypothetical protein